MILLATLAVRWPLAHAEFGRSGDGTGSFYGIIARNYLLRDNGPTLWMPVISVGPAHFEPTVYAHHPPAVPLFVAACMKLFGDTDFAVRLAPLLFTLAAIAALYGALLRRSRWAATVGAMLLAFVPLSVRFGQMPDVVNSQLAFAGILIAWAYARWLEAPTPGRLAGVVAALLSGFLTDWPAFYFVPVIGAHLLLARPRGWFRAGVVVASVAIASFGLLYVWVSLASHDWHRLFHQFANRAAKTETDDDHAFTLGSWLRGIWKFNRDLHAWPLVLAGLAGCLLAVARWRKAPEVALLAAWAALHVIVGKQGVLNHDWWWWPVTVAFCAGAAHLARAARDPIPRGAIFGLVTAFCAACAATEVAHVTSRTYLDSGVPYSVRELGDAIRASTPPGRTALLFQDELQPYVSYYADRPLIQPVWDVTTLQGSLDARYGYLFYTFTQTTPDPPATYVMPKAYVGKAPALVAFLRTRYPEREVGKFVTFDLTRTAR